MLPLQEHGPLTGVAPGEPPPPDPPLEEPPLPPDPPAGGTVINTTVDVGASVSVGTSVAVLARVGDADAVGELVSVKVGRETAVCVRPIISAVRASGFVICSERGGDDDERESLSDDKNEIIRQQKTMMPQPETDAAIRF